MKPELEHVDQKQALADLLESIALEEVSLAHFVNAEAEKIQKIAKSKDISAEKMIKLQNSVAKTMRSAIKKEMLLQFKLEDVLEAKHDNKDNQNNDCKNHYKNC